jgi:hypothetical protein
LKESFEWLCFHTNRWTKWDQLEFAVATNELQFDPLVDNIHLDFVDHSSKICVPSLKIHKPCKYQWDKNTAMKHFLNKLTEKKIELKTFRDFFTDAVWNELIAVQQSL